jgi:hypothetical protein
MRWLRASLARKLFVSYLLVIVAGRATLRTFEGRAANT